MTFFNFKSLDKNDAALAILDALQLRPGLATNFAQRVLWRIARFCCVCVAVCVWLRVCVCVAA